MLIATTTTNCLQLFESETKLQPNCIKKLFVPCSGEAQLNFNLSIIKTKTFYYYSNSNNYFVARERAAFFDLNLILTKTLMQF